MDLKYFLLQSKYEEYNIGSILKKTNDNFINLNTNEVVNVKFVPNEWLELSEKEALFLITKKDNERIKLHKNNIFQKLNELNINDYCYYNNRNYYLSTVVQRFNKNNAVYYTLQNKELGQVEASYSQIELFVDETKKIEEILELLLNPNCDIQRVDITKRCVLLLAYQLNDKNYFKMLINETKEKLEINNKVIQSILYYLAKDKVYDLLKLLLGKCDIKKCDNEFFMKFGLEIVKLSDNELLNIVFKYISTTTILNNGETFLTNLFKVNVDEGIIKKVVETKLFDVNLPNKVGETPLMLACKKMMVDVVNVLLLNGADASYKDHAAFECTVLAKANQPLKEKEANEIKNALMNVKAPVQNLNIEGEYPFNYHVNPVRNPIKPIKSIGQHPNFNYNDMLKVMTLLYTNRGDLVKKGKDGECVFTLTYNMKDKRFFNLLIQNCNQKINFIRNCEQMLFRIIDDGDMDILKKSLDISIIDAKDDSILLKLALKTLIKKFENHWKLIVERCTNKNVIMASNETFLTSLIKGNVDPKLIIGVIMSKLFDLNTVNRINETIIMLACERLLPEVVEILLKSGADLSFNNYRAIDLLHTGKIKDIDKKTKIIEYIINKNKIKDVPFISKYIPKSERIFENIKIDSKVIYYKEDGGELYPLYGIVRWTGVDGDNKYLYGLELEEKDNYGTDGEFETQRLFQCQNGHGVVVSIKFVAPDVRSLLTENYDEVILSKASDVCQFCIPRKIFLGKQFGIEASENSLFLDSIIFALFAKSHLFDHLISPFFTGRKNDLITINVKYILSWEIVYSLREFGFVSCQKIKDLKNIILKYGTPFENINKNELDKDMFERIITKLSIDNPLIRFTNFHKNITGAVYLQLSSMLDLGIKSITTQSFVQISVAQMKVMFYEIPAALIIYVSKEDRTVNKDKYIIPSNEINISQLFINSIKECNKCTSLAIYQCTSCVVNMMSLIKGLYCEEHKCYHKELLKFPYMEYITQSDISMHLKCIISLTNGYPLTYVKEVGLYKDWICFDNKTSSKPSVITKSNVTKFLNKTDEDKLNDIQVNIEPEIKSLLLSSYLFVYENAAMSCY